MFVDEVSFADVGSTWKFLPDERCSCNFSFFGNRKIQVILTRFFIIKYRTSLSWTVSGVLNLNQKKNQVLTSNRCGPSGSFKWLHVLSHVPEMMALLGNMTSCCSHFSWHDTTTEDRAEDCSCESFSQKCEMLSSIRENFFTIFNLTGFWIENILFCCFLFISVALVRCGIV